jgi:mono/diheme cytochrome c family protein
VPDFFQASTRSSAAAGTSKNAPSKILFPEAMRIASFLPLFAVPAAVLAETNTVDHAGILQELGDANFKSGEQIYNNLCINCHGGDGVTATLPLARAFGKGELKFGADPFSMFKTLTNGNGMMGPQTWMTGQERYDVIHYIRVKFMKPMHPAYAEINDGYLEELPTVEAAPEDEEIGERDFGLALASQLGREISSALTIKLGKNHTISYDLHSMDQAGVWQGGFLNLKNTQHYRERGGGVAEVGGELIPGLQIWKWAHDGSFDYPTKDLLPRGPIPSAWMEYRGHYLSDNRVVLSYSINGREILEMPGKAKGFGAIEHTIRVAPGGQVLKLAVGQLLEGESGFLPLKSKLVELIENGEGLAVIKGETQFVAAGLAGESTGLTWEIDSQNRIILTIPASDESRVFQVVRHSGIGDAELLSLASYLGLKLIRKNLPDPEKNLGGGESRWAEKIKTTGELGPSDLAYTLDTLGLPEPNPWNAWLRTSALAFFPDGRMVISTHGGDIWVVDGIDDSLANLRWKRFAAGLYEPFGLQVINNTIYVTCKDRLTRLHDFNEDGEADFYESFSADDDVSSFFHAFNFDLQVDNDGNLYYVKAGQYTSYALPGAVIKISPSGDKREIFATGFRTPNGMGILPDGRVTVSDNQGNWMPASKVSLIRKDGFYGYSQTQAQKEGLWAPDGGKIDHTKVVAPDSFDQPLIWMPQDYDNSSGGQLFVDDERWGPLSGRLLHTSFGKGWLYYMMIQEVGDVAQAAIIQLNLDAITGIQRARVNPKDGQVYAVGLNGWNGHGRKGLGQGGVHRFRYTGEPVLLVTNTQVRPGGIELRFNFDLDPDKAADLDRYKLTQWNYKWESNYGSKNYSVKTGKVGVDNLVVEEARISEDGQSVFLAIPDLQPANQVKIELRAPAAAGGELEELIYLTINAIPVERAAQAE